MPPDSTQSFTVGLAEDEEEPKEKPWFIYILIGIAYILIG